MPIATNPFRIDGPLEAQDVFVGREKALAWVQSRLVAGERLLTLYGLPQVGKTSLLRRLPQHVGSRYLCVFDWIASPAKWELAPWQAQLWQAVAVVVERAGLDWPAALETKPADLAAWQGLAEVLGERELLLLVDGLKLESAAPGLWETMLEWLASLTRALPLRVLISIQGSWLQVETTSPLASLPAFELGFLAEHETKRLLSDVAGESVHFDYDAVRLIQRLTGGHPFLVQLYGSTLFERYGERGRIDVHSAQGAAEAVQQAAENLWRHLWSGLSSAAKMALAALGEQHGRHDLVTAEDVANFLRWRRVIIAAEDVEQALDELAARGVLVRLGHHTYQVRMALLSRWLGETKPVAAVARETKRFRRAAPPSQSSKMPRPIRWTAVLSWALSIVIIALIAYTWSSRSTPSVMPMPVGTLSLPVTTTPRVTPTPVVIKRVVFSRQMVKDGPSQLVAMSQDGSDPVELTEGHDDTWPIWSPDGKQVLFVSTRSGNKDLWIVDSTGGEPRQVTDHPDDEDTPAWSPTGDRIAFAALREGNWDIYTSRPDGSRTERLTSDLAVDVAPSWSPDGQWIVFASYRDENWELYLVSADGAEIVRLTENDATDYAPAWSPLGDAIAFESYRDGNMEIYVMSTDGLQVRNISNSAAVNDHGPAWTDQGDRLLFYSNEQGGWDILALNVDGSGKVNLTQSAELERHPACQW